MPAMEERRLSPLDRFLTEIDSAFRTAGGTPTRANRPNPARDIPEPELTPREKSHAAGLMRVNHAGEVAAQEQRDAGDVFSAAARTRVQRVVRKRSDPAGVL